MTLSSMTQTAWPFLQRSGYLRAIGVALLACGFYALTLPANHTEAEDAYDYAAQVERAVDMTRLHPHHLLYIPAMRALYVTASRSGLSIRGYPLLAAVSVVSAGIALACFYLLLVRGVHCPEACGLLATALLGLTYGFWRYAGEAEIYLPALALILATLLAVATSRSFALALPLAALAGATHALAWLPLLFGVWGWHAAQGRMRRACAWCAACAPLAFLTYLPALAADLSGAKPGWRSVVRALTAAPALAHDVASLNFATAFPAVRRLVQVAFPGRMLGEELFMGERTPVLLGVAATLTLVCFTGIGLVALVRARQAATAVTVCDGERKGALALGSGWLLAHGLVVVAVEPANPEMWIMALPPIVLLVALLVLDPLVRSGRSFLAGAMVLALGVHNACGGMAPLASPQGDYNAAKAAWLRDKVTASDVVITADSVVLARYLAYELPCHVVCLAVHGATESVRSGEALASRAGNVYILGDVFDPPAFLAHRKPERAAGVAALAHELRPRCRRVADNGLGGVFVLEGRFP